MWRVGRKKWKPLRRVRRHPTWITIQAEERKKRRALGREIGWISEELGKDIWGEYDKLYAILKEFIKIHLKFQQSMDLLGLYFQIYAVIVNNYRLPQPNNG